LRARIWGSRGSLASPGPDTVRYGGNTSCVEIEVDRDTVLILDAGTGLARLGTELENTRPKRVHILLTHLHLDHIQGLGFFAPLWHEHNELHVWGPRSTAMSLRRRISRYLSPPLFPAQFSDAASIPTFHDVPKGGWEIGDIHISWSRIAHPGPTLGYRLERNGRSLAYLPDHEPALRRNLEKTPAKKISGSTLMRGVDLLLHDAQYTEEEYGSKVGWGHSTVEQAVTVARACEARKLLLFHHDPLHKDSDLDRMLDRAQDLWPGEEEPELAREGMEIDIS
jgi:ribonuclease BN (tRNA processing enzyme)